MEKKFFLSIFTVCFSAVALLFSACDRQNKKSLVVLTTGDVPPFSVSDDKNVTGLDIDIAKMIASDIGMSVEFKLLNFHDMMLAIEKKEGDLALAGISFSKERAEKLDLSTPYHESTMVLLQLNKNPQLEVKDLMEKKVLVRAGTLHEELAKKEWSSVRNLYIRSENILKPKQIIEALTTNNPDMRYDAVVLDVDEAREIIKSNETIKMITTKIPNSNNGLVISFPKGSQYFKMCSDSLDKAIKDGRIDKLKEKWLK